METQHHCGSLLQNLSDYVDGSLNPNLCLELEKHLKECPNCLVVVNTLRKTIELYRTEQVSPDLPDTVRQRLYARLNLQDFHT